jgi:hypothetical protein
MRLGAIAILILLVMVECDRLCGERVGILGDRFLIEFRGDRNFDVVVLLSAIAFWLRLGSIAILMLLVC